MPGSFNGLFPLFKQEYLREKIFSSLGISAADMGVKIPIMDKLKYTNKRYIFKPGDIVRYKPGLDYIYGEEGVVLKVKNLEVIPHGGNPIQQLVRVVFTSAGENLKLKTRRIAKKLFFNEDIEQELTTFDNNRLEYVRDCPRSWIEPISTQEIHTHRFSDLLDEKD